MDYLYWALLGFTSGLSGYGGYYYGQWEYKRVTATLKKAEKLKKKLGL